MLKVTDKRGVKACKNRQKRGKCVTEIVDTLLET